LIWILERWQSLFQLLSLVFYVYSPIVFIDVKKAEFNKKQQSSHQVNKYIVYILKKLYLLLAPVDQHKGNVSTIFHNQNTTEEKPPSYDSLSETRKDLQFTPIYYNTMEQVQVSPTKNGTPISAITPPSLYPNNI
jgi:hypothetical protein